MKPQLLAAALAASVAVAVVAVYHPAFEGDWVFDDANLVRPSPALGDWDGLRRAVSTDLYRQAAPRLEASPYWRPLALASYWVDTRLGYAPRALHVANVLLHCLAAALLALVLLRRHGDAEGRAPLAAAAIAALWWALHPMNVEPVAWISGRYDVLSGVALLAFLALPWRPGPGRAALHGLIFLSGLLSKEGFAAMAVVVPALDWAERRRAAAAAPRWAAVVAAIGIWWGARTALGIPRLDAPELSLVPGLLATYLDVVGAYFLRAIWPPALTLGHVYASGGAPGIGLGAAVFAGLAALAVRRRRLAVPAAIFLAAFAPTALAVGRFGEIPERYFYLPSIGLALLVGELAAACLAARTALARWGAPAAFAALTVAGLVRVERRLPEWRSDDTIFAAALRVNPDDPEANLRAGLEAGRERRWSDARRALEIAQRSRPESGRIAGALAWAMLETRDPAAAAGQAERATRLAPEEPNGWFYLARARHETGDHAGELSAIERLLQVSPDFPGAREGREAAACEVSGREDCAQAARAPR